MYSPKYFRDSLPDWKKKKDPFLSRIFYRPGSVYIASMCAKLNISANTVSYFSAILGMFTCSCFFIDNYFCRIAGAILVNIWLILDCTDGNLARSVKKQPFGEFADGISSYILVGFLCTAIGYSVYHTGGILLVPGIPIIILLGALASSSDSLMRLIYQKFKSDRINLENEGKIEKESEARMDHSQVSNWRVRIEAELGIGGLLPIFILLGVVFKVLDIIVLYCFLYYGLSFLVSALLFIRKAMKLTKTIEG